MIGAPAAHARTSTMRPGGVARRLALTAALVALAAAEQPTGREPPCSEPLCTPFALIVEPHAANVGMVAASARFAASLGAAHAYVYVHAPILPPLGPRQRAEALHEHNVSLELLGLETRLTVVGEAQARCLRAHPRLLLAIAQTCDPHPLQPGLLERRFAWLFDHSLGPPVPTVCGCQAAPGCLVDGVRKLEARFGWPLLPLAYARSVYSALHVAARGGGGGAAEPTDASERLAAAAAAAAAGAPRLPGPPLRPAWLLPAQFGGRIEDEAKRRVWVGRVRVRFAIFSGTDFSRWHWDMLRSARPKRPIGFSVFAPVHHRYKRNFTALKKYFLHTFKERPRLAIFSQSDDTWDVGLTIGRDADFVLPILDERTDAAHLAERELSRDVELALALERPMVLWRPVAVRYGLQHQITYADSAGLADALDAAVAARHNATAYAILQAAMAQTHRLRFRYAASLACFNDRWFWGYGALQREHICQRSAGGGGGGGGGGAHGTPGTADTGGAKCAAALGARAALDTKQLLTPAPPKPLPPPPTPKECGAPAATPFGMVIEPLGWHIEVLPASVRFALSLGAPHVYVHAATVHHLNMSARVGMDELLAFDAEPRLTVVRKKKEAQCLAADAKLLFVLVQTCDPHPLETDHSRQRFEWLFGMARRTQVPVICGCHNVPDCLWRGVRRSEAHFGKPLMTVTFTRAAYEFVHAQQVRNASAVALQHVGIHTSAGAPTTLRPAFFVPAHIGRKAEEHARAAAHAHTGRVNFASFSSINMRQKNWESLRFLRPPSDIQVTAFGLVWAGESAVKFGKLQRILRSGKLRPQHMRFRHREGSWDEGLQVGMETDFVLPMLDEYADPRYLTHGKLSSSVALALAFERPLVIWRPAADAYGLRGQITFENSSGLNKAIGEAVAARHDTSRYVALQAAMTRAHLQTFREGMQQACHNAVWFWSFGKLQKDWLCKGASAETLLRAKREDEALPPTYGRLPAAASEGVKFVSPPKHVHHPRPAAPLPRVPLPPEATLPRAAIDDDAALPAAADVAVKRPAAAPVLRPARPQPAAEAPPRERRPVAPARQPQPSRPAGAPARAAQPVPSARPAAQPAPTVQPRPATPARAQPQPAAAAGGVGVGAGVGVLPAPLNTAAPLPAQPQPVLPLAPATAAQQQQQQPQCTDSVCWLTEGAIDLRFLIRTVFSVGTLLVGVALYERVSGYYKMKELAERFEQLESEIKIGGGRRGRSTSVTRSSGTLHFSG